MRDLFALQLSSFTFKESKGISATKSKEEAMVKKLKKKGMLELIQQMQGKDMSVQLQETKRFFAEWKGKYEQVDDIIFVGITV